MASYKVRESAFLHVLTNLNLNYIFPALYSINVTEVGQRAAVAGSL